MDVNEENYISTKSRIESFLQLTSGKENIVEEIENIIRTWKFKSDTNLKAISDDVNNVIEAVRKELFCSSEDYTVYDGIHRVVHNYIWENIMPMVRAHFHEEDSELCEKSKYLSKMSNKPDEMLHNFSSVPFTAAVVELSMLDSYQSPSEKINCFCTTYDLLFAEVKSALVTLISEYSDRELEIPTMSNEEVKPILVDIFIKSKLLYPCSNLFYVKLFGNAIIERDRHKRLIVRNFEKVMDDIQSMRKKGCEGKPDWMEGDLLQMNSIDYCRVMEISANNDRLSSQHENATLIDEKTRRLVSLVLLSTSENEYVPSNV